MTSNLASEAIVEQCGKGSTATLEELVDAVRPSLSRHFQPALIGRFTIVPFRPLSEAALKNIVALKLDKVARRMHDVHKLAFSCSPALVDAIAQSCSAVETGARNAQAVIDRNILPGVSRQLLAKMGEKGKKYSQVHIGVDKKGGFEIVFAEEGEMKAKKTSSKKNGTGKKGKVG